MSYVLYRHFDRAGRLLYAGRTNEPPRRLRDHRQTKAWWAEVASTTYAPYESLEALKAAERTAIETEHPLWNVQHNKPAKSARTIRTPRPIIPRAAPSARISTPG